MYLLDYQKFRTIRGRILPLSLFLLLWLLSRQDYFDFKFMNYSTKKLRKEI